MSVLCFHKAATFVIVTAPENDVWTSILLVSKAYLTYSACFMNLAFVFFIIIIVTSGLVYLFLVLELFYFCIHLRKS